MDILYPKRCPICDNVVNAFGFENGKFKTGGIIHKECLGKVEFVKGPVCMKCGKPLGYGSEEEFCKDCLAAGHIYTRGYSVFAYRSISGSIYRFKYMGRQEYAEFYGRATKKLLGKKLGNIDIDAVIPVPMYKKKEKRRGYNQAYVYAKVVSEQLELPFYPDIIKRIKDTRPMKELDISRRRNNLKKAFIMPGNDVKFKSILIVDDIYTTGSTIDAIAHEFRMAGVERIYFLTLAIGQTN